MPAAYEKSVFINCPFDKEFEPLFHAIVFTIAALGFAPRSARETEGEPEPRIVRFAKGILQSKYSIHDLSRYQGEGSQNLSRFNMPLELGMAVGIQFSRDSIQPLSGDRHRWCVLVPPNFVHQSVISDLAAYDSWDHDGEPATAIGKVASWLSVQPDFRPPAPNAKAILGAYPKLCERLKEARANALGNLIWPEITAAAAAVAADLRV